MRLVNIRHPLFPFAASIVPTTILFLLLSFVHHELFLYKFFYRSWYVQGVTTWLFFAALFFVTFRMMLVSEERRILENKISVHRVRIINQESAAELLQRIPRSYQEAISMRRIGELLRGYLHGEEVALLNQELSRRDVEQVDTGHVVLQALRQLIPVLGFLGTVVGLSLGMAQFPDIAQSGSNLDALRGILKDFAGSLSVAFDTTLLALGYTVIVVLLASLLRHREEFFVGEVDDMARQLITKLSPIASHPARTEGADGDFLQEWAQRCRAAFENALTEGLSACLAAWEKESSQATKEIMEGLAAQMMNHVRQVGEHMRQNGDAMVRELVAIRDSIHTPPSYEIIVQPLGNKRDG